jgi:putative endonuclease
MGRDYNFWIYTVTNRNHSVLYIGVTNSLSRRTWKHREGIGANFPARYQCQKLIYYEHYRDIRDAIARESQLKNGGVPRNCTHQPFESELARLRCRRVARQVTVRDFSTSPPASLEMTESLFQ